MFYVAVAGLVLSAIVHVASWAGVPVHKVVPAVWLLHILCLVVAFTAFSRNRRARRAAGLFPRVPISIAVVCAVVVVAGFQGALRSAPPLNGAVTEEEQGHWVLRQGKNGPVIRALTPTESREVELSMIRGFSGIWLVFCAISVALLSADMPNVASVPVLR